MENKNVKTSSSRSPQVPWSVTQVDAHKEAIFLLGCYDSEDQVEYKKRSSEQRDLFIDSLQFKSQKVVNKSGGV